MLVCKLNHLAEQVKESDKMQKAVAFLNQKDLERIPSGRVDIDGDEVYARIMEYQTLPYEELKYEAHKKYIDIHYVTAGAEAIGCIDTTELVDTDEYNPEKDIYFGRPRQSAEVSWVILPQGSLAVFYPSDAHAPKGLVGNSSVIKKVVIKIAV
jgi:biofilm protein TabA